MLSVAELQAMTGKHHFLRFVSTILFLFHTSCQRPSGSFFLADSTSLNSLVMEPGSSYSIKNHRRRRRQKTLPGRFARMPRLTGKLDATAKKTQLSGKMLVSLKRGRWRGRPITCPLQRLLINPRGQETLYVGWPIFDNAPNCCACAPARC